MPVRALRGATTVPVNDRMAIVDSTTELLTELIDANDLAPDQVISAVFTATEDLDASYPAEAARDLGWTQVGLLCVQEMRVSGSLPMCLRVLVLIETERAPQELRHQYLRGAQGLRPDLAS